MLNSLKLIIIYLFNLFQQKSIKITTENTMCWCCNPKKTIIEKLNSLLNEKQHIIIDAEHAPRGHDGDRDEHQDNSEYKENGNNKNNLDEELDHRIKFVSEALTSPEYLKPILSGREYLELQRRPIGEPVRYHDEQTSKQLISIRMDIAVKMHNHLNKLLNLTKKELALTRKYPPYAYYKRDDQLIRIINVHDVCLCKPDNCSDLGRKCPCLETTASYISSHCKCGCFEMEIDQPGEGIEMCVPIKNGWTPAEFRRVNQSIEKRAYPVDPLVTMYMYMINAITYKMKKIT